MEASRANLDPAGIPRVRHGLLSMQPDVTLCALASRGNPGAYAALHDRYWPRIYAFVSHMLSGRGPREDCEEVAQDAFAQAFRALPSRDRSVPFKPWLFKIARNRSIDFLRLKQRPPVEDVTELDLAGGSNVEDEAERRAQVAWLVESVHALPERQRAALVLRELGGLSYKEIAVALESTVPSVRLLLVRARDQLAEKGAEHGLGGRSLKRKLAAVLPVAPVVSAWPALAAQLGLAGGGAAAGGVGLTATKVGAILLASGAIAGGAVGIEESVRKANEKDIAASGPASQPGGVSTQEPVALIGDPSRERSRHGGGGDRSGHGGRDNGGGDSSGPGPGGTDRGGGSEDGSKREGSGRRDDDEGGSGRRGDDSPEEAEDHRSGGGDGERGGSSEPDGGSGEDHGGSGEGSGSGGGSGKDSGSGEDEDPEDPDGP